MLLFWFFLPSVRSLVVVLCWLVVLVIDRLFTYLLYPRPSRDSTMRTRRTVPYTLTKPSGEKIQRVTTVSPTGVKTIRITQLSPAPATASAVAHGSASGEPTVQRSTPMPEPHATAAAAEGRTLPSAISSPPMMQPMPTTPSELERQFFMIPPPAYAGTSTIPDASTALPAGTTWTGSATPVSTSRDPLVYQYPAYSTYGAIGTTSNDTRASSTFDARAGFELPFACPRMSSNASTTNPPALPGL